MCQTLLCCKGLAQCHAWRVCVCVSRRQGSYVPWSTHTHPLSSLCASFFIIFFHSLTPTFSHAHTHTPSKPGHRCSGACAGASEEVQPPGVHPVAQQPPHTRPGDNDAGGTRGGGLGSSSRWRRRCSRRRLGWRQQQGPPPPTPSTTASASPACDGAEVRSRGKWGWFEQHNADCPLTNSLVLTRREPPLLLLLSCSLCCAACTVEANSCAAAAVAVVTAAVFIAAARP